MMDDHTHPNSYQCQSCPGCELSSVNLDFRNTGTRFRLFPQTPLLQGFETPEIVWISKRPDEIGPGPADNRMYVIDAIEKEPYEFPHMPPYQGETHSPAKASEEGHFDHLEVGTHQFEAAHMYGTLRFVMDIWECYLGHEIEWAFSETYPYLEIVTWLDWNNAHCGYGFIEAGYRLDDDDRKFPLNMNFDVLAHEIGHAILYSVLGMPEPGKSTAEYFSFHETGGDLIAMISLLHFNSVIDRLLITSSGNLYLKNELNRLGEESNTRQIRLASHNLTMNDVPNVKVPLETLTIKELHDISQPMTGALFDLLVEVFQKNLLQAGLITQELDELSRGNPVKIENQDHIQNEFDVAYALDPDGFKKALVDARDYLGTTFAQNLKALSFDVTFSSAAQNMFNIDNAFSSGNYNAEIEEVFRWRNII